MILHSKFKYWALLSLVLLMVFFGLFILVFKILLLSEVDFVAGIIFSLLLFGFTWIWLLFGELRTKIIAVKINNDNIEVSRYYGLATVEIYHLNEFEGFVTADLSSRYDKYEYLYLVKEGKRRIALSQFYHRNYGDLKKMLTLKVSDMGKNHISVLEHIKDIFR